MAASPTTLDDIAESIADLTTMVSSEFSSVRREMASEFANVRQEMKSEFDEVHAEIREANGRLTCIEGVGEAHEADIKELYEMVTELRKDIKKLTREERHRLADLEAFALRVAEQTGIPFK